MAALSPLGPSSSRASPQVKLKRSGSDFIDPLYYNQLLAELRQVQETGTAFFGNFVYDTRGVPANGLLPSGTPIFQADAQALLADPAATKDALVFDRLASSSVEAKSGAVKFLLAPPDSVRSGVLIRTAANRAAQRHGAAFKSPVVTGTPSDLKPAMEALEFIRKAKAHYSGSSSGGWKEQLTAQLTQRAAPWEAVDLQSTPFSEEEAMLVLVGRYILGNCWTDVAKLLPGRTGKMVKSFWHSKLRPRYFKYGWQGRELSPPPELHKSIQIRPGSAAGEGLVGAVGDPSADDSEDDEPREEVKEETNEEALAREHALMQSALAAKDPAAVLRAYHLQYARLQPGLEEQSTRDSDWEERCFLCNDGGELLCCQYGHGAEGEPCWKGYHKACLGARAPYSDASPWHCPRHACASDRCSERVQSECATCPNSYCGMHQPGFAKPQPAGGVLRIVCKRCRMVRGDKSGNTEAGAVSPDGAAGVTERRRRQRRRERDAAKRVEEERQRERRERDRRKREEESEHGHEDLGDQPDWVLVLSSIKAMPTNNGGPFVSRIEKAIELARGRVHPEVVEQLQLSLSASVYKSNSAGNTRNVALAAIDLHRSFERREKQQLDRNG